MKRGTVLMETVLVLPLLMTMIFAIVQFSLVWYARIMTQYAAYNAARAALVYHPGEYRVAGPDNKVTEIFEKKKGPCWQAACRTLAWVSSSPEREDGSKFGIPGWYDRIPNSTCIGQQVRIVQSPENSVEMTNAPVVKVTVEFDYPLLVPVIGRMLAYLDRVEKDAPSRYEAWGWNPDSTGLAKLDTLRHHAMGVDFITLSATAILPKPYRTSHFARISTNEYQNVTMGLSGVR